MRISLVSLGQTGAGPVYSLEMAKTLSQRDDCELQVIISSGVANIKVWNDTFASIGVDYHVIETYKHNALSAIVSCLNIPKQQHLVRLIQDFNPDVLYIPFGLMWARYVYRKLHDRIRIITTIHDVDHHDKWYNLSMAELGAYIFTVGADKFVDAHVVLNKKDARIVEKRTGKRVVVIPHAGFDYYFKSAISGEKRLNRCIGFFGRIEVYKGLDLLIEAFENTHTDDLKLLIAGKGQIAATLLNRIDNNPNIELINRYIGDDEFEGLMKRIDFAVLPYKRASQSGVIPMCFAAGKTVIATNVGALSEQVPCGTGIITEVDSGKIASAIDFLYNEPKTIFEYGDNARHYAETELSWAKSAMHLMKFAESVCESRSCKSNVVE